jgi:hypothetical protein
MNIKTFDTYIGIIINKKLSILEENQPDLPDSKEDTSLLLKTHILKNAIEELKEIYIPPFYKTPSELSGMSEIEELKTRIFCNSIIQESGIVLRLPQMTILTAMNIFNRLYWKISYTTIEPFHALCASIFIATKTEETLRRLRDVISSCYYILKKKEKGVKILSNMKFQKELVLDVLSDEYLNLKSNVMVVETYMLKELGFFLYALSDHPHKYLIHFIKILRGTRELLQRSWNYLNDAYKTSLAVNYPPHVLACAAIFLAARMYYFVLPNSVKWWETFDTKIEDVQDVAAEILNLFEIGKIDLNDIRIIMKKYSKEFNEEEEKRKMVKIEDVQGRKNEKIRKEYYRRSRDRSRSKKKKKDRSRSKNKRRSRSRESEEFRERSRDRHHRKRKHSEEFSRRKSDKRKHSREKRDYRRKKSDSYSNSSVEKRKKSN